MNVHQCTQLGANGDESGDEVGEPIDELDYSDDGPCERAAREEGRERERVCVCVCMCVCACVTHVCVGEHIEGGDGDDDGNDDAGGECVSRVSE